MTTTSTAVTSPGTTAPVVASSDTIEAPSSTVTEQVSEPPTYPSFDEVPDGGAPVGLGTPPDGFSPGLAWGHQGWSGGSGALALVEVDDAGLATGNSITVGVGGIPPYQPNIWDEGGNPDGELITLGEITGRWRAWPGIDESGFFTAPIDEQTRVTVGGTLPRDQLEDFIATISFGADVSSPSFDMLPGYVLVDTREGITNGEYTWTVNYSTADLTSQFLLTTTYRPTQPLVQLTLQPGWEQLTVGGRPAVASYGQTPGQLSPLPDSSPALDSLVIDVRPDLRVQMQNLVGGPDDRTSELPSLDLLALAQDLVAFTPSGWDEIVAIADAYQASAPIPPARRPGAFNLGFDATAIDLTGECEPQPTTGSIVDLHVVP